jgi:hypothetical protein
MEFNQFAEGLVRALRSRRDDVCAGRGRPLSQLTHLLVEPLQLGLKLLEFRLDDVLPIG